MARSAACRARRRDPARRQGPCSWVRPERAVFRRLRGGCSLGRSSHHLTVEVPAAGRCSRTKAATRSAPPTRPELVQGDHLGAELRDSLTPVGRVSEGIAQRDAFPARTASSSASPPSHNGKDHCDGCWIRFAAKESSDVDDPNDHSVAIAVAGPRAAGESKRSSARSPAMTAFGAMRRPDVVLAGGRPALADFRLLS